MERKRWVIVEEIEQLTEENANKFLSPSVYGQAKIKGKYIRDKNGKLLPVLVRVERQKVPMGKVIRVERPESGWRGALNSLKKGLAALFKKKDDD